MGDQQKAAFFGWRNIIILFINYGLLYGVAFYGYSVTFPAMIKALGWARGDASVAHTIRAVIVGFSAPLCVYLITRIGNRWTMVAGTALCSISLVLLATMPLDMVLWTILWGAGVGFGLGTAGQVTIQNTVTQWFSKRRAFCIGLVMLAGTIGGMVSQPLFAYMIKETGRWQVGWLASGIIAVFGMIVVFFLKSKPSDYGQHVDGIDPEQAKADAAGPKAKAAAKTYRTNVTWSLAEAMRTRSFWFLALSYTVFSMSIYIVTAHGVLHMTDVGFTRMQAAWVLSFFVLGGLARLVVGYVGDIIEPRWIIGFLLILTAGCLAVFWKAPSVTALATVTCIHGACYGGGLVLIPACIGNYYSAASFAKLNTVIYPMNIGFAAIVPAGAGYIFQFYKSYDAAFIILIALLLIAFVGSLFMSPPVKNE